MKNNIYLLIFSTLNFHLKSNAIAESIKQLTLEIEINGTEYEKNLINFIHEDK
jgi:hypothetical protein